MERSQDNSSFAGTAQPTEDYSPSQPAYDPLALTVMSALLEYDREVPADTLYQRMKDNGIKRNWVTACIRNTLLRNEMIWAEDGVITVSESGTDYVAANAHRFEEAEREAVKTKKDIAKETARLRASETGALPPLNELLLTARAMSDEINRMRQALGEPPEDFGYLEGYDEAAMPALVSTLTSDMKKLEKRLDD